MVHDDTDLQERAQAVGAALQAHAARLAVAESCTGGLLAKTVTDCAGASAWFDRGVVVYSNAAKHDLAGVSPDDIAQHGAVSGPVAEALALGMVVRGPVDYSIAITGVAGPEGGSTEKPVGTVWIAWGTPLGVEAQVFAFPGGRDAVRRASVAAALDGLRDRLAAAESGAV